MAKQQGKFVFVSNQHLRTSIGRSANTRPTNKHKRRSFKKYRGQGR